MLFFLLVVGVMTELGTQHTIQLSFKLIDNLELLDNVSHGEMKKWFADDTDTYEVTVQSEFGSEERGCFSGTAYCITHFTIEGFYHDEDGNVETKIFPCKMTYSGSSAYAMLMCEVWEIVEEYDASEDEEESDDEEEPDYLEEAHKKGFGDGVVGNIIKKKWAERKIQKFIMKRYGWISDKPCPLPSDYVRGHYN